MVTEEPSKSKVIDSPGRISQPAVPLQYLILYEDAPGTSAQSRETVRRPVVCPVGVWGVSGATDGVREEGEMRSMRVSAVCQGWSVTDQDRVPAVVSSVAEETSRARLTEPSRSMKSSL